MDFAQNKEKTFTAGSGRAWSFFSRLSFSGLTLPFMVFALAAAFLAESYISKSKALFGWGPMVFPQWICYGAFLIVLVNLRRNVTGRKKAGAQSLFSGSQFIFLSILALAIFLLPVFGYRPVLSGFIFTASLLMGVRGWKISYALVWSLALSLSSWWLFSHVLKVFLP